MTGAGRVAQILSALGRPGKTRRHPAAMVGLEFVDAPTGRIAYEAEGAGPAVLLVHGWQGSPRDFSTLTPALQNAGARTVALDLPAHGASDGDSLTPPDAAAAILAVARKEGPFAAIIAHSFGCPAVALALQDGLRAGAIVFFAPPARQIDQLRRLCARNGLSPADTEELIRRALASGVEFFDVPRLAKERREPLLIVHAHDDEMTPFAGAREIADAWPNAKLLAVEGLGHNLTMRDKALVAATVRFTLGA